MFTYVQAILLGLLQGVTELFPVSSLGHSVLLPALLHWPLDEHAPFFLIFLIATHFATALVLLGFFFKDWLRIIQGFFCSLIQRRIAEDDVYARLAWLIIIATIPAGIIGILFQESIQNLFATPLFVAYILILNGVLLYSIEILKKHRQRLHNTLAAGDLAISRMPWLAAFGTGIAQALALLPGFSRTGAALGGGLLAGLDHESAARFSFLLATPIILAAAVLKLPELFTTKGYPVGEIAVGALAAGIAAFISISFLTRYFKTNTLRPFALYCVLAGILSIVLLTR
ncbi:undecaprenyl-diphosphate phosphatase [Patescibacteria group bacterium]|nr:undecaprenyl-diphosphate phosphatase [Patescibacteria group bacterium]